jgi:GR25 family glycosyltransferase involved in LPS biosynthesis
MYPNGYVINLKRRPDRLERFNKEVGQQLRLTVVEAVDGELLDLDDPTLRSNVNPWNWTNLPEKSLRGVIGCCLSHLKCYDLISKGDDPYAFVFEDDCAWLDETKSQEATIHWLSQLKLPAKFGIIFLNDWWCTTTPFNQIFNRVHGTLTTEAYLISKEYAQILYTANITNIGAIDAHMSQLLSRHPDWPCYQLTDKYKLFKQYNRKDSDIR